MAEQFDPYHRWLGIRPEEQPADHYRLLALARFEDDPEVIRDAAEQRIRHVRSYQSGQYSQLSQKILNELAAARACLLDVGSKAEYDRKLRQSAMVEEERNPPPLPARVARSLARGPADDANFQDAGQRLRKPGKIAESAKMAIKPPSRPTSGGIPPKRKTREEWIRQVVQPFVILRNVVAGLSANAGRAVAAAYPRSGWPLLRSVLVGVFGGSLVMSVIVAAIWLSPSDEPETVPEVPEKPSNVESSPTYTMRKIAGRSPELDMWRIQQVYGSRELGRTVDAFDDLAISPDSWAFVVQDDGYAEVWSLKSGEKTHSISGRLDFGHLSRDGCVMASVNDKKFQVWNILDNKVTSTFDIVAERIRGATFSANNQFVFWSESNYDQQKKEKTYILHVWDAVANREVYVDSIPGSTTVPHGVPSSDGKTLALRHQGELRFIEPQSKRTIQRIEKGGYPIVGTSDGYFFLKDRGEFSFFSTASREVRPFFTGEKLAVDSYRLLSNDRRIVVLLDSRKELRLYDVASKRLLGTTESDSYVSSFDVTKDGRTAVILSDEIVSLHNLKTGRNSRRLGGNKKFAVDYRNIRFACDDTAVLCYGRKSLELISTSDGMRELRKGGPHSTIHSIAYSPDGSLIASQCYSESRVNVWATRSGKQLWSRFGEHRGGGGGSRVGGIQFSDDGKTLVATVGRAGFTAWNTTTAVPIHVANFKTGGSSAQACGDLAIAPGAKFIATCSDESSDDKENQVDIWDLKSDHETRSLAGHTGTVRSVTFSPTEEILASGASDRKIKLWSTSDWREVDSFDASVSILRFMPDGRHLANAHSRGVDLYDMKTRNKVKTFGPRAGSELAVAGDSKWIASADSRRVYLWSIDATEPKLTLELKGCNGLALHPDGNSLAVAWENLMVEFNISDVTNAK